MAVSASGSAFVRQGKGHYWSLFPVSIPVVHMFGSLAIVEYDGKILDVAVLANRARFRVSAADRARIAAEDVAPERKPQSARTKRRHAAKKRNAPCSS